MKRKDTGKPVRSGAPRSSAPRARPVGDFADPYKKARRPRPAAGEAPSCARRPRPPAGEAPPCARRPRPAGDEAPPYARERRPPRSEPGEGGFAGRERGGREGGFTVNLDPDVARVFRGDASVNKALRLVMQLMQVVQGPPRFGARTERPAGEGPRRGYRGSAEARGFTRKPRFEEDDGQ
jgi:hypothetical protein